MSLLEFIKPHEDVVFMTELLRSSKGEASGGPMRSSVARPKFGLYEKIKEKKRQLENEMWNVSAKKQRREEILGEISEMQQRFLMRKRKLKQQELAELETEIAEVENGTKLEEFTKLTEPYTKECQKRSFCRPAAPPDVFGELTNGSQVLEDFLIHVNNEVPKFQIQNADLCERCSEQMHLHQTLSMLVCPRCGASKIYMDATASLQAYSDELDFSSFSYKRITHFGDHLQSLQARESIDIPEEVLQQVMARLYDERTDVVEDVTIQKVREVLKKLKLRKYYEHVQLIWCKITGKSPPRMTPEMEERLKVCFLAASAAFQRHIPEGRKNMVSYTFVCQKLCVLLGYTDFIPFFCQLKSRDKKVKAEMCWAKICKDLNWPFIPSTP